MVEAFEIWTGGCRSGAPSPAASSACGCGAGARARRWPRSSTPSRRRSRSPQAIGRLGNWWNQELYGKPTDLPWALEIDLDHREDGYQQHDTFHPMFLYEMLWNLALVGVLLWAERGSGSGRGRLFALYVCGYTIGRLWIELMRIDPANEILGLRLNVWTSVVAFAGGLATSWLGAAARSTSRAVRRASSDADDDTDSSDDG